MNTINLHSSFILEALGENPAALVVQAESLLLEQLPGRALVPCQGLNFERYAQLGYCETTVLPEPRPCFFRFWGGEDFDRLFTDYEQAVWEVRWQEQVLNVVQLAWQTSCGSEERNWIVAENKEIAEEFLLDLERKTHHPGKAILVFTGGHWRRSEALYEATQNASFDDLVLANDLKETIRKDFRQFLTAEDQYTRLGISWRRGAIFIGPPGNGKTHCVRALVKELDVPCLYVQSIEHAHYPENMMWQMVFERARGLRPCVLILEDLDSLVTNENRSFFLNQLDGFEHNHGLIVLATTNYPERIDSAIIDRPSRFDRKYHFRLPTLAERACFLLEWQRLLATETGWNEEQVESIASLTEGFSFDYLKELIVSSLMFWLQDKDKPFYQSLTQQAKLLTQQMVTAPHVPVSWIEQSL